MQRTTAKSCKVYHYFIDHVPIVTIQYVQIQQLEKQLEQCKQRVQGIWNGDQLDALQIPASSKVPAWSSKTIKDSLKMRLMLGANG